MERYHQRHDKSPLKGGKRPRRAKYRQYMRVPVCAGIVAGVVFMEKSEIWFWVWAEYTDKLGVFADIRAASTH